MDVSTLSKTLVACLGPLLPYLLKKAGDKGIDAGLKKAGQRGWELATSLWQKLWPKVEAKSSAVEAAEDVANNPDDEDAMAALRLQLKKLLTEDESLASELAQLLEQGDQAGVHIEVTASGERSVAAGGDIRGPVTTGDPIIRPDQEQK